MGMVRCLPALLCVATVAALMAPLAICAPDEEGAPAISAPEVAPPAPEQQQNGQWLAVILIVICAAFALRLLTVTVWPDFARRCAAAYGSHRGYALLWGTASAGLVVIIALLLGSVGGGGEALAALLLIALVVMACVGATGVTLPYGERWVLRDGIERQPRPLLSVLAGSVVTSFLFLIPCVGQVLLLLMLVAGLGAAIQAWSGRGQPAPAEPPEETAEPGP